MPPDPLESRRATVVGPPAPTGVRIDVDDPLRPDVLALLEQHLADMHATSPPESVHALDPTSLTGPGVTFWTARDAAGGLLGCVALTQLDATGSELKSMRTVPAARGRGVGAALLVRAVEAATARGDRAALLVRAVEAATARGDRAVHLETGTQEYFAAARRLYARAGFVACAPFGSYVEDPNSAFFRLDLAPGDART